MAGRGKEEVGGGRGATAAGDEAALMPLLIGAHKQWPQRVVEAGEGVDKGGRGARDGEVASPHVARGRGMCVCLCVCGNLTVSCVAGEQSLWLSTNTSAHLELAKSCHTKGKRGWRWHRGRAREDCLPRSIHIHIHMYVCSCALALPRYVHTLLRTRSLSPSSSSSFSSFS